MATAYRKIAFTFISTLCMFTAYTQLTQTIRGRVVDQFLQKPLEGASVAIPALNKSVITTEDGNFRIKEVPVGSHQVRVSYVGFREATLENIVVNAGKEVVLTISMEANVEMQEEVTVRARSRKNRPLNDMSVVSARAFTVEETQKYAASVNDPLRMVTGFAGVASADDGGNDQVHRSQSLLASSLGSGG